MNDEQPADADAFTRPKCIRLVSDLEKVRRYLQSTEPNARSDFAIATCTSAIETLRRVGSAMDSMALDMRGSEESKTKLANKLYDQTESLSRCADAFARLALEILAVKAESKKPRDATGIGAFIADLVKRAKQAGIPVGVYSARDDADDADDADGSPSDAAQSEPASAAAPA